jgi:tRNA modification GTPase
VNTIAALATPLGRSGIGVIRLSGAESIVIARTFVSDADFDPAPRIATLVKLHDESGVIDNALITYFKAPHSFTGEDVVEISCHGSPVVLRQVLDLVLKAGARIAEPGEFSLRALANGRMDLAEAEAIRDLIDAQTTAAARQAMRQLSGELSHELQPLKDDLLNVIVVLESALEFVEDDLPVAETQKVREKLIAIRADVARMASTFKAGKLIREGIRVAIVGRPNVGKSSLFNALVGSDRAIVTEIAGTTRDQLHEKFTIDNIPISLIDTAGLRETTDTVESIGVDRSKRTMADADLVIAVLDVADDQTEEDIEIIRSIEATQHLIVINKTDKVDAARVDDFISSLKTRINGGTAAVVAVSAKTGFGLASLERSIVEPVASDSISADGFLISDARHYDLLLRADAELAQSIGLLDTSTSEEIILIGLHNALRLLGQITGETTTEDMLTRIFSTFCIGK